MKKRRKLFKFFACFSNETEENETELFTTTTSTTSSHHHKLISADNLNDTNSKLLDPFLENKFKQTRIFSSTPCFRTNHIVGQNNFVVAGSSSNDLGALVSQGREVSDSFVSEALNVSCCHFSELPQGSSDVVNKQNQPPLAQQEDLPEEEQVSGSSYDNVSKKSLDSNADDNNKKHENNNINYNNNDDGNKNDADDDDNDDVDDYNHIVTSSSVPNNYYKNNESGDDVDESNEQQQQRHVGGVNDDAKQQTPVESSDGDDDDEVTKNLQKRKYVITELIETERDYVKDLGIIAEDYVNIMQNQVIPTPSGFEGKDKIIFGNIHQIYDFHKRIFLQELSECQEDPHKLGSIFVRYERRLHMYVKYCENKPKSEYLVAEYIDYCEEIRQKLGHRLQLPDLLIKPVQRIMKYQLLLADILKFSARAGEDVCDLEKAVEVMKVIPKAANDMMNVGRLQGFEGKITVQGLLLMQDILYVADLNKSAMATKMDRSLQFKERRVFLFEQIIIFSDEIDKKRNNMSNPGYIFKNSILINRMSMEEDTNEDPISFTLIDKNQGSDLRLVCHAPSNEMTFNWISHIRNLLDIQGDFLKALVSPIEYQKVQEQKNRVIAKEFSESDISSLQIHHNIQQQHHHHQQQHYQQQQSKSTKKQQKHKSSTTSHVLRKTHSQPKSTIDSCTTPSQGQHHRTSSNPAIRTFKIKDSRESALSLLESFLDKTTKIIPDDLRSRSESPSTVKRTFLDGLRSTFLPFKSQSQEDLKTKHSISVNKKHSHHCTAANFITTASTTSSTAIHVNSIASSSTSNHKAVELQLPLATNASVAGIMTTATTTTATNQHRESLLKDKNDIDIGMISTNSEFLNQNSAVNETEKLINDVSNMDKKNAIKNETDFEIKSENSKTNCENRSDTTRNNQCLVKQHQYSVDKIDCKTHKSMNHQLRRHESEKRQTNDEGSRTNSVLTSSLKFPIGGGSSSSSRSPYHQLINRQNSRASNPDKCHQHGCDVTRLFHCDSDSRLFHCDSDPSIKGSDNISNASYSKNTEAVVPPRFIKGLTDVRICEGNNAIFFCRVCGQPRPHVAWEGPGSKPITSLTNRFTVTYFDDGLARLELHSVNFDDVGEYSCTASNAAGALRTSAMLSVVTDI